MQTNAPRTDDMQTDTPQTDSPMTVERFRRLVPKLTARQLEQMPPEYLPPSIPLDAVDPQAEPAKWSALEQLASACAQRDMAERMADDSGLGDDFRQALDTAESATTQGLDELKRLCEELGAQAGSQHLDDDMLSDANQMLAQARREAAERGEYVGELSRALATIDRACAGDERFQARVAAARQRAKQVLSRLESALGRFHVLELDIAQGAMRAQQVECEHQLECIKSLEERIAAVDAKLERANGLGSRMLQPRVARQQRERLLQRRQTLIQQRDSAEIFISEEDLLHWLDVLVNASLYTDQEHWEQKARHARLVLYRLMNTYCLQQELAAHQVATQPAPGVNAKAAINYYLKSEQFILDYFARKRREVTLWLSDAAQTKLAQLDNTRDAILAEYRRHTRG